MPSVLPVVLSIPFTNKVTLLKIDYLAKLLLSINFDGKCICANRISTLHPWSLPIDLGKKEKRLFIPKPGILRLFSRNIIILIYFFNTSLSYSHLSNKCRITLIDFERKFPPPLLLSFKFFPPSTPRLLQLKSVSKKRLHICYCI